MILAEKTTSRILELRESRELKGSQDPRRVSDYALVREQASRVAAALLEGRASLEGQRVALLLEPGPLFVSAFLGVLLAGGCAVVLSPLHPPAESLFFCEDSGATHLLFSTAWSARAEAAAPAGMKRLAIEELLAAAPSPAPGRTPADGDPALQLYTSGTTGKPKGAVLTHANLSVQQRLLREAWGLCPSDVLLHVLPLHHMHGLCIALLSALGAGAGVRFLSFEGAFDPARVWEELAHSTVFMAVPTIYAKLLAAFDAASPETRERWRGHASRLRLATSGSAALPVSLADQWRSITGRIPLERFGMTELGVALSNPLEGERRAGCVGPPLPTVETRILGENGRPAEQGELWVAGPSVFAGYHQRPEATAEAFSALEDGRIFFRTGDTVRRESEGHFRILGRTSVDILKSGGYKLSALEIEEVLREHPGVAEVAVIGVPDEVWGDRVVACVVARETLNASDGEATLRDFAKTRMASYKVPKRIVFLAELPRNALGKVLKKELQKRVVSA